jgi:hypothetical protein
MCFVRGRLGQRCYAVVTDFVVGQAERVHSRVFAVESHNTDDQRSPIALEEIKKEEKNIIYIKLARAPQRFGECNGADVADLISIQVELGQGIVATVFQARQ